MICDSCGRIKDDLRCPIKDFFDDWFKPIDPDCDFKIPFGHIKNGNIILHNKTYMLKGIV